MVTKILLFFAVYFCFCAVVSGASYPAAEEVQPDPFSTEEDDLSFPAFEEQKNYFEAGQQHHSEAFHYDEDSGNFRYHSSKFEVRSPLHVLDSHADQIQYAECTEDPLLQVSTSSKELANSFSEGDVLSFSSKLGSSCLGKRKVAFLKLKGKPQVTQEGNDYLLSSSFTHLKPKELFSTAEFRGFQENLKTPASTDGSDPVYKEDRADADHQDDDEYEEEEEQRASGFRKRHLPAHVIKLIDLIQADGFDDSLITTNDKRFWSWLSEKASGLSEALKQKVDEAVAGAKSLQENVVQKLQSTSRDAAEWLKKQVKDEIAAAPEEKRKANTKRDLEATLSKTLFGPVNVELGLKFTMNFALLLSVKKNEIQVRVEAKAVASGSLGVSVKSDGNEKDITLLPKFTALVPPFPTPIPSLFIKLEPWITVSGSFATKLVIFPDPIGYKATGTVGLIATYAGEWKTSSFNEVKWERMNWPESWASVLKGIEASASLTITPKIGVQVGPSIMGLLDLKGGPFINLPLVFTLSFTSSCSLEFKFNAELQIGMTLELGIFGIASIKGSASFKPYSFPEVKTCVIPGCGRGQYRKRSGEGIMACALPGARGGNKGGTTRPGIFGLGSKAPTTKKGTTTKPKGTTKPKPKGTTKPKSTGTTKPKPKGTTKPKPKRTTKPKPKRTTKPKGTTKPKPKPTTKKGTTKPKPKPTPKKDNKKPR